MPGASCPNHHGPKAQVNKQEAIVGSLIGMAVGDAMGLPCEGLSKQRQARMFPQLDSYRFLFNKGMVSDDTEHACMACQALIRSGGDPEIFAKDLAWRLRLWLLGLPAGTGRATALGILKLWIGFSPARSGVYSAGNGPAVRAAMIGIAFGHDPMRVRRLVRISTRMTHTDARAEYAALAVALATHWAATQQRVSGEFYLSALKHLLAGDDAEELIRLLERAVASANAAYSTAAYAQSLGLERGVSGYAYHTVPVVIHAWLESATDFRRGVTTLIRCGGDTDTTAALLGSILGAHLGTQGIPWEWRKHLWEWPRTLPWLERLGRRLARVADGAPPLRPVPLLVPGIMLRNLLFLLVVLIHGLRRLLPPY
jgi:ADP-ribosylglycohydrolase